MRRLVLIAAVLAAGVVVDPPSAMADATGVFGPIELVSSGALAEGEQPQQGLYADEPVISGDGQYVAMHGSFGGTEGVWRRDLANDRLELVAPGNATLPSISEEGRFVSFTTTRALVPGDDNKGPDVYERDMSKPYAESCTSAMVTAETCPYKLVSAVNGGEAALTYESEEPLEPSEQEAFEREYGSLAAGRTAMSGNGQYVVFETTAESNLAGAHTPELQIAVRDVATDTTELVSANANPETGEPITTGSGPSLSDVPVPVLSNGNGTERFGAVWPGGTFTPTFSAISTGSPQGITAFGASISADGSSVTWLGQDVAEQVLTMQAWRASMLSGTEVEFSEPLWRELHNPLAPTRRVAGMSQPEAPQCKESGETAPRSPATLSDPCQGPFVREGEATDGGVFSVSPNTASINALPRLSANGMSVVFVSNALFAANKTEFGNIYDRSDDLYVANMEPGLNRAEAVRPLTEVDSSNSEERLLDEPITEFAISPEGEKVAFSTIRGVFELPSISFTTAPLALAGESELYVVDLTTGTLSRLTHGMGGEEEPTSQPHEEEGGGTIYSYPEGVGNFSPSFTTDGETVAFSSTANDLVYGDGNTGEGAAGALGADAFVVHQIPFTPEPPRQEISPVPANPAPTHYWSIYATGAGAPGGAIVHVTLPGAGTVTARAFARTVSSRALASAAARSSTAGTVTLRLQLPASDARLARRAGLSSSVHVTFDAPGHAPLGQWLTVKFSAPRGGAAARRRARRRRTRRRRSRRTR